MKITDIHVYGFGKLENLSISNLEEFQVFYGENEAGKSTLMAFIHGILFGFPTKQQSDLRYEPRGQGKYGGRIRVLHPIRGYAVIERVKGKAAGDVTVTLDNGTTGGEVLLKELLSNFDKQLFQAVFSFNLHGLQNIHHIKKEELSRFLFSAGTIGTDRLSFAEAELQKELEARFKPAGKKPSLNRKLTELRALESELNKAAEKNNRYEDLAVKKDGLLKELAGLQTELPLIESQIARKKEWGKISQLAREEAALTSEISEIEDICFPARGIEKLGALQQRSIQLQQQIEYLLEKRKILDEELEGLKPNQLLLEHAPEIFGIVDQIPFFEQARVEEKQSEAKLIDLEDKISILKEKLQLTLLDEEIAVIKTDIYNRQKSQELQLGIQRLSDLKQQLDERFNEEKNTLVAIEKELEEVQSRMLSKEARLSLELDVGAGKSRSEIEEQLEEVRKSLNFYEENKKQRAEQEKYHKKQKVMQLSFGGLAALALAIYGALSKEWPIMLIGIVGGLTAGLALVKTNTKSLPSNKEENAEINRLSIKESRLSKLLSEPPGSGFHASARLEEDDLLRKRLNELRVKLETQNLQYEKVITGYEQWEEKNTERKRKAAALSEELRIPEYIASHFPAEAFELLEECKGAVRDKQRIVERLEILREIQSGLEAEIVNLSSLLPNGIYAGFHHSTHLLRTALKAEEEKQIRFHERQAKMEEVGPELSVLLMELEGTKKEESDLLLLAETNDIDQFYKIGKLAEKKAILSDRLEQVKRELSYSFLDINERKQMLEKGIEESSITLLQERADYIKKTIPLIIEKTASIRMEVQLLEEGGVYSELLHNFRLMKSELAEEAREWAVRRVALELLAKTADRYKQFHFPRVLEKAEEYLSFLTEERYFKLYLADTGAGFLVERKDHALFEANELSQATAEQVYLSLRLALATTLYEKCRLPLIIDDSFVNFDDNREKRVIELLKKIGRGQVLFFTCHTRLLDYFNESEIHNLGKIPVK